MVLLRLSMASASPTTTRGWKPSASRRYRTSQPAVSSVCRAFRVVFLLWGFCCVERDPDTVQPRFLPSFAASIHRIAIPSLSGFAVLRVASLHPRYFEHTRRKERGRRKDEEIVSQGHLCNQVTADEDGDGNDRERVPLWCNTGME